MALEPPWIHVLQEDNVTLKCQGGHAAGDPSTRWFHNGSAIPAQGRPSYSFQASKEDRGEYTCQTDQTSLSDPVYLDVISGQWRRPRAGLGGPGETSPAHRGFRGRGAAASCLKAFPPPVSPCPPFVQCVWWVDVPKRFLWVCSAGLPQSWLSKNRDKAANKPRGRKEAEGNSGW